MYFVFFIFFQSMLTYAKIRRITAENFYKFAIILPISCIIAPFIVDTQVVCNTRDYTQFDPPVPVGATAKQLYIVG